MNVCFLGCTPDPEATCALAARNSSSLAAQDSSSLAARDCTEWAEHEAKKKERYERGKLRIEAVIDHRRTKI